MTPPADVGGSKKPTHFQAWYPQQTKQWE